VSHFTSIIVVITQLKAIKNDAILSLVNCVTYETKRRGRCKVLSSSKPHRLDARNG
jgi:hypothetical protein